MITADRRDFASIVPVIGFIYVLGNGQEYYGPRSQTALSQRDIQTSKNFLLASNALRHATPEALQWALNSYGTASVYIDPTPQSYERAGVSRKPCLAWPKGKPFRFTRDE